jgi:AraC-like DNA-binding protein
MIRVQTHSRSEKYREGCWMSNQIESWSARLTAACQTFLGEVTREPPRDLTNVLGELARNIEHPANHLEETFLRLVLIDVLLRLEPSLVTRRRELASPTWIAQIAHAPVSRLFDVFAERMRTLGAVGTEIQVDIDDVASRAARLIDREFTGRLTVRELARKLECDSKRLQKYFRARYNVTIHRYVDRVRSEEAVRLIIGEGIKVDAVALMVGLRSRKNLYALVKRTTGRQLSDIRKTARPTNSSGNIHLFGGPANGGRRRKS